MRSILALVLVALAGPAQAGPGSVDWQKRMVRCTGSGAPHMRDAQGEVAVARIGAERAARLDALRNCLETLKGVRVSGGDTVGDALAGDPALRAKVEGVVRGFQVVDKRYFSDSGVELDVEVPIDGVAEAVLPQAAAPAAAPSARSTSTGLLVDARGTGAAPALAPRLLDGNGMELYGAGMVSPDQRKKGGAAAYATDPERARKELAERLGDRPLLVKAASGRGGDVVLSEADAEALRKAPPGFLAEGRVVIVTDGGGTR